VRGKRNPWRVVPQADLALENIRECVEGRWLDADLRDNPSKTPQIAKIGSYECNDCMNSASRILLNLIPAVTAREPTQWHAGFADPLPRARRLSGD
jgi:hypothetical protein